MIRLEQIKLPVGHPASALEQKIRKLLGLSKTEPLPAIRIRRRALDARKKPDLYYVYTVDVLFDENKTKALLQKDRTGKLKSVEERSYEIPSCGTLPLNTRPVVVGSGPAGLFCAYLLSLKGFCPIVLERGEDVESRSRRVSSFWNGTQGLHPESNVQFGEGGAGTFSDGKLNTGVSDKAGRNRFILDTFVRSGAPEEISYAAKPHLGTDVLSSVVKNMRDQIMELGGSVYFGMKLKDIHLEGQKIASVSVEETFPNRELPAIFIKKEDGNYELKTGIVVLAIGHSARDTFQRLYDLHVPMQQKNFAVGLRIEHAQNMIDQSQYGRDSHEGIGAADYKLARKSSNGRNVYSFCMCPGGYVVDASSEENRIAVNGMSYSGRNGENANAALVVSVDGRDFDSDHPLAGLAFQRKLEESAYQAGKGKVPVQLFSDFENNRESRGAGKIEPMHKGSYRFSNLRTLFGEEINEALIESIHAFAKQIRGYDDPDAVLTGVESRTSSPVRILRDEECQSSIRGLYPCGEGAGYAGGIVSAAMDGMRVAEKIISMYDSKRFQKTEH